MPKIASGENLNTTVSNDELGSRKEILFFFLYEQENQNFILEMTANLFITEGCHSEKEKNEQNGVSSRLFSSGF